MADLEGIKEGDRVWVAKRPERKEETMKDEKQIEEALRKVGSTDGTKYPAMTYEQGVEEALRWVLGDIPDDEFEYTMDV